MPVIVSVGRSGTTLLRLMLDSHPELAVPPETGFLPAIWERREELDAETLADLVVAAPQWPDFHLDEAELRAALRALRPFSAAEGTRCFYRLYARRFGKRRWGDKTPVYGRHMPAIQDLLPEARFLHLIRDGRDVALSLRPLWFAPGQDARTLAAHWRDGIEAARRDAPACRHYLEVRYEDLVAEPERVLARVCGFLDFAYTPEMLGYPARAAARLGEVRDQRQADGRLVTREERLGFHPLLTAPPRPERTGRWRREMSAVEIAEFEAVAGDLLAALGYERGRSCRL
jgi:hypothetical protein